MFSALVCSTWCLLLTPVRSPRFTIAAVDVSNKQSCGVVLVPQGREHEWLFNNDDGRRSIAESADFGRLYFVTLNRGHIFGTASEIQEELSPFIRDLSASVTSAIPYLAVAEDLGSRVIVCERESPLSGGKRCACVH